MDVLVWHREGIFPSSANTSELSSSSVPVTGEVEEELAHGTSLS